MPAAHNVIVGTAGHIDHGKSALVEALTGTHPDRLEEEKRRGITIDLGFAFLDLDGVRLGFVDVPGHERFVRNMLAGVGGIDLVLLVIAADEGIKPQTREHFDICCLLGISRGLVALTKTDLVAPDRADLVRIEIEEFLRGSFLESAPIVPVSARTGADLDRLKQELLRVATQVPPRDASRPFRLPVDRAFAMKGFGAVVTGTLVAGSVAAGDEVELFPAGRRLRVRGVHSGGRAVARAVAGQRTAVNLSGIDLDSLARGMTLAAPGLFRTTSRVDVTLALLPSARPLKNRAQAHFHAGTAELLAEVILLEGGESLAPGGSAFAQLRLAAPALLLPGDRFIVRQFSPVVTIGGGRVLDPEPAHSGARAAASAVPVLRVLERGTRDEVLAALVASDPRGLLLAAVVSRTGWLPAELLSLAQRLAATGSVRLLGSPPVAFASSAALEEARRLLTLAVDAFHRANPLLPGIPREELLGSLPRGTLPELARAALDDLLGAGAVVLAGERVARSGRTISLDADEARARDAIAHAFERAGLAVPRPAEVLETLSIDAKRAQKLLQLLIRDQTVVRVAEELVFHRTAIDRLRAQLAAYKRERGERITVPAFKELAGISRKYAIPLLEFLDRERVTRRVGDERVIL